MSRLTGYNKPDIPRQNQTCRVLKSEPSQAHLRIQSGFATLWALIWLIGMAALAYFCLMRHIPALELATESRLNTALSATAPDNVTSSVTGYTATLQGQVADQAEKQQLGEIAASTAGVRNVVNGLIVSDVPSAQADDSTPIIGQTEPAGTETAETETAESTSSNAEAPTESLDTNQSEPEIQAIAKLNEVSPDETTESNSSIEADPPAQAAPAESAATVEPTVVAKDPASLELEVDDGTLFISGQIAESDELELLIAEAKVAFDIDFISDSSETSATTSEAGWLDGITALLPTLAPLNAPGIAISSDRISLSGTAPDQASHDAIINRALELLGGYSIIERINVLPAEAMARETPADEAAANKALAEQALIAEKPAEAESTEVETTEETQPASQTSTEAPSIDVADAIRAAYEALPNKQILFQSGSAILTTESQVVLRDIVRLLEEYPEAKMDIDGHTDSQGNADINLQLSQQRANAVRDFIVDQGISVFRLAAFGFGEGVPIADNDSPEGRAINRRIEFKF